MPNCSLRVLGDTLTAIPELTRLCRERIARDPALSRRIAGRARQHRRPPRRAVRQMGRAVAPQLGREPDHAAAAGA